MSYHVKKNLKALFGLTVLIAAVTCTGSAFAGERVALVIGNSDYHTGPLKNPGNDAELMARVLRDLNFEVLSYSNLNLQEMKSALREYHRRLTPGGAGFFFYAGHGLQLNGENYLIPVDIGKLAPHEVPYELLNVGMVLGSDG